MNIKNILKKTIPHLGALVLFFLMVLIYFYPSFEGKVLQQSDIAHVKGVAQETLEYDEPTGWNGSLFAGMPTYQITGYETGINFIKHFYAFIYSETAGPIFFFLVTSYILFILLGVPWWLAILGAIASAFQSYNMIIIIAGHITKFWVLAFTPLVLSGLLLIFRRKFLSGFLIFSLGLSLMLIVNHLQITYYVAIFCFILFIGFVINSLYKKEYKPLWMATATLVLGVALVVLSNIDNIYINYESGNESMRGKAELTPLENEGSKVTEGLEKDYVFAWSYGKGETFSLMLPNVMGGPSGGTLGKDSHLYKEMKKYGAQVGKEIQAPTYWGEKLFTSGPVYFGAIICFLFLFAILIIPKNYKWWLLGATVFFIFLAWGKNLAWFNDFMYYHFPLYNKFRTVETALVIPGFIFPILAVLSIKELITHDIDTKKIRKSLFISAGVTAGICLVFWIMPGFFFTFQSSYDAQYGMPDWYYDALILDRQGLLKADALRSFIFIVLAAGLIFLYIQAKNKKKLLPFFITGLVILILCDLWQIDKRYLNTDSFSSKKSVSDQQFAKTTADNIILQDPNLSYRVLNLNNTFQDSRTSYYHKSIGGYNAAKLGRYQDLIDRRLIPEISSVINAINSSNTMEELTNAFALCPSLNMLNTKYIIYNPEQPPLINPYAFGNAWFVQSYRFVSTPDEEMAALNSINPKEEAILDVQFKENLDNIKIIPDENSSIEMTAYYPNKVEYNSSSSQAGLAIFSEIYYKNGWKAYIDGERIPISRADWILRAIVIPAGNHKIEFVFEPDNVHLFGKITTVFSGLLVVLLLGSLIFYIVRRRDSFNSPE